MKYLFRCAAIGLLSFLWPVIWIGAADAARLVEGGVQNSGAAEAPKPKESQIEKGAKAPKPTASQIEKGAKALKPTDRITINFDDADIRSVIKFISEITGRNFLVDDKVKGAITILSPVEITVAEAYAVFLSALEMKGFTVVEAGKITKIVLSREARHRDIVTIKGSDVKVGRQDRIITQIVPLSFADANSLKGMLTPLVSKDSQIVAYTPTNTLVITDYASNIYRLLSIIRDMDVEGSEEKITVIPLQHASAQVLVNEILSLVETKTKTTARVVRRPVKGQEATAATVESSGITVSKLIADERTNSLILLANRTETRKILDLVAKLDQPLPPGQNRINVYYLENAVAEELVQVLTQLPTKAAAVKGPGGQAAGAQAPLLGEDVQILADKPTNSLIIIASAQDYETLRGVIQKLDIMRSQVLVEALIAEVSLTKTKELGVEWQFAKDTSNDTLVFGGTGKNVPGSPGIPITQANAASLLLGIFQGPITIAGQEFLNLRALVRAFQDVSDFNILSTPHILTLDNQEAEIIVAENRPFLKSQTGTAESTIPTTDGTATTSVLQTFEFKDVGITLRLTPQISKGKLVRLNIFQEVSDIIGELETAGTFITAKRQAQTTVVVENGQTVVIGGLIRDSSLKSESGVPCLASVPVLGSLFRTRGRDDTKRNLLIFITPHILTSSAELAEITDYKRKESEARRKEYERSLKDDFKETVDMIVK